MWTLVKSILRIEFFCGRMIQSKFEERGWVGEYKMSKSDKKCRNIFEIISFFFFNCFQFLSSYGYR